MGSAVASASQIWAGMLVALLPVLAAASATPETLTFDSQEDLHRALTVRLRSALEAGWTLIDVSPEDDSSGTGFTLANGIDVERHVAMSDGSYVYRIGPAELPAHPIKPAETLLEAIRGRGGIELVADCGGSYVESYLLDGFGVGPEARDLVTRSLAAADDLESAWVAGRRAVFQLEVGGSPVDLVVTLTDEGGVAEAELRRFASRRDETVYRRRGAMARALRRAFVSRIHQEDDRVVLRTSRGRFMIDPDGTAFRSRHGDGDGEYEGCGC